jgi:hypothetical protein
MHGNDNVVLHMTKKQAQLCVARLYAWYEVWPTVGMVIKKVSWCLCWWDTLRHVCCDLLLDGQSSAKLIKSGLPAHRQLVMVLFPTYGCQLSSAALLAHPQCGTCACVEAGVQAEEGVDLLFRSLCLGANGLGSDWQLGACSICTEFQGWGKGEQLRQSRGGYVLVGW